VQKARNTGLGLESEELRTALRDALKGSDARFCDLLARHGGLPGPRPNLTLGAAIGDSLSQEGKSARALLERLARDPAKVDSARAFLPMAAAYGYVARLESDASDAWNGVFELSADDRTPVRTALISALTAWARGPGHPDVLIIHAEEWLGERDREHRDAAIAITLDVLSDRQALTASNDRSQLLAWVQTALTQLADAPRAAERSPARRVALTALPGTLASIGSAFRGAPDGFDWLIERCKEAKHPDLRVAFEKAIDRLRGGDTGLPSSSIDQLRQALASSAKPPRDPSRIREGTGRGKKGDRRAR
jgi:hypothetical protein